MLRAGAHLARRLAQVWFGLGLWRSISWWWTPASAYEQPLADMDYGRRGGVAVLHALFCCGYAIQWYWAQMIVRMAAADLRGGTKLD